MHGPDAGSLGPPAPFSPWYHANPDSAMGPTVKGCTCVIPAARPGQATARPEWWGASHGRAMQAVWWQRCHPIPARVECMHRGGTSEGVHHGVVVVPADPALASAVLGDGAVGQRVGRRPLREGGAPPVAGDQADRHVTRRGEALGDLPAEEPAHRPAHPDDQNPHKSRERRRPQHARTRTERDCDETDGGVMDSRKVATMPFRAGSRWDRDVGSGVLPAAEAPGLQNLGAENGF